MKHARENRAVVQERTSMKEKSANRASQQDGRPYPSKNTINPNRGLNEDAQKQKTNQEEENETTNAYTDSTSNRNDTADNKQDNESKSSRNSKNNDERE